ncbi:adhesion G protein-coupled receptor B2 [Trichonephila clavipes]|nr:adhesion G protein-coupled receptor B2 [Trichonephila clavipes]
MHLWISVTPNAAVLFVDVAIQPEVRFIAKQNSLMKIGNNGNLVLGPFDESAPCLMIVLMNCQTKLRIIPLTAVKSVAILEKLLLDNNAFKTKKPLLTPIIKVVSLGYEKVGFLATILQKDLAGMYPLSMIIGSSGVEIILPQEDRRTLWCY